MRKNRIGKLFISRNGESISEALVAVLITALGALLFATMVSVSTRMIRNSETKMNAYYQEISVDPDGNGTQQTILFSDADSDKELTVNGSSTKTVTFYQNSEGTASYYAGGEP